MNDALTASDVALLSNNRDNDDFMGSSFMWIFALLILAGGGFGNVWGGNGINNAATQDFIQNGFNFNDLQDQNRDIMTAISNGTAQAVSAVDQAKYENISVAKDIQANLSGQLSNIAMAQQAGIANSNECCCNILRSIDGVNYNAAQNTAAINANTTAQIQKLMDVVQGNRMADMQNQINQLQLQSAMCGVVRYPLASTYYAGNSPFMTCGSCCNS
jgi:hypothetical protein